mmetsp:Transcript_6820/g.12954  ORF Transcript_6820/g.12954 Transcript_6820/m.12954 type:complete len:342 (+) Transcript_6820:241-1266(+)
MLRLPKRNPNDLMNICQEDCLKPKQTNRALDYGRCDSHNLAAPLSVAGRTVMLNAGTFQGTRRAFEDRWSVDVSPDGLAIVVGVYDGHNGAEAAEHLRERLGRAVLEHGEVLTEPARALREACRQVDAQLAQDQALHFRKRQAGSTAVLCLLVPGTLAVANVGDSRATVIDQKGNVIILTAQHRASKRAESERLAKLGGTVEVGSDGMARAGGQLEVSRAFGHASLKSFIVAEPDIYIKPLAEAQALVLASDGLGDLVPNQVIVKTLASSLCTRPAETLARLAQAKGAADNVCVLSLRFADHNTIDHSGEVSKGLATVQPLVLEGHEEARAVRDNNTVKVD